MRKSVIVSGFFAAQLAVVALAACGGKTPPADNAASSASAPATSSAPAADTAAASASSATADHTPAPSATPTPPAPPPPVELPASFVTVQTKLFGYGDQLNDAIKAAGTDCKKIGAAMNKVVSDPGFAKAFKDYIAEVTKLRADQRDQAKANFDAQQKKYDGMMDPVKACDKDAGVKAAQGKMQKIVQANMKPLMDALAGAMAGGAASAAPSAAPPPGKKP